MKIGTNIGMSNSPDAATFETGPAYEYTFAMDFSKLVSGDVDLGISAYDNFPKVISSLQLDRIEHIGADALREGEGHQVMGYLMGLYLTYIDMYPW